ncbi:MAG: nucleotidyltransferase domain-containing protein [Bacteroidota bacterium]|jgi:predicted nucleotidyltransferase
MGKIEALALAEKFSELVIARFSPVKIILFGSFANDNWRDDSDIDIAVVLNKLKEDYLLTLNKLYKLRREVDTSIEPVLMIEGKDPSGFLESIETYGTMLYPKS